VTFFLEYDTGTEPLTELIRKLLGYARFAAAGGPRWPVLFWLPAADREHHLHQRLAAGGGLPVPVATAIHSAAPAGRSWWLHGHPGQLTLDELEARS